MLLLGRVPGQAGYYQNPNGLPSINNASFVSPNERNHEKKVANFMNRQVQFHSRSDLDPMYDMSSSSSSTKFPVLFLFMSKEKKCQLCVYHLVVHNRALSVKEVLSSIAKAFEAKSPAMKATFVLYTPFTGMATNVDEFPFDIDFDMLRHMQIGQFKFSLDANGKKVIEDAMVDAATANTIKIELYFKFESKKDSGVKTGVKTAGEDTTKNTTEQTEQTEQATHVSKTAADETTKK